MMSKSPSPNEERTNVRAPFWNGARDLSRRNVRITEMGWQIPSLLRQPTLLRTKVRAPEPICSQQRLWAGWVFLTIWLGLAGIAAAQPVILHLRGGDRLTGTITAEDTNLVVLSTRWGKQMVVPAAEILKREPLPATPEAKAADTKPATPVAAGSTNTVARPATLAASTPPPPIKPKPPKRWTGEAQVGVDLVFSERKRQLYSGRFKAGYVYEHFRNVFDYSFAYGKTDGLLSDDRMYGSAKTDYDLGRRIYVYNLGGAGFDETRKIDLRYELGPGFGYHLLKLTNFVLNTELGANYQVQELSDNTKTELFYYRLAENSTWAINGRFSVDEKFEFFPRVEDWGKYRFRFESNLRYILINNLSFVVTAVDQYDTQPAAGVGRNDLQFRSSISVKF